MGINSLNPFHWVALHKQQVADAWRIPEAVANSGQGGYFVAEQMLNPRSSRHGNPEQSHAAAHAGQFHAGQFAQAPQDPLNLAHRPRYQPLSSLIGPHFGWMDDMINRHVNMFHPMHDAPTTPPGAQEQVVPQPALGSEHQPGPAAPALSSAQASQGLNAAHDQMDRAPLSPDECIGVHQLRRAEGMNQAAWHLNENAREQQQQRQQAATDAAAAAGAAAP